MQWVIHEFGFKLYIVTGSLRFLLQLDRQSAPEKAVKEALETLSQLLLIIDSLNSSLQLLNSCDKSLAPDK